MFTIALALFLGFQSLFSWNSLFDLQREILEEEEGVVSILVFLELALRHDTKKTGRIVSILFQSLFSWNSLFDCLPRGEGNGGDMQFQSLFSWNSLFDWVQVVNSLHARICFNPCFPGTRSSTILFAASERKS